MSDNQNATVAAPVVKTKEEKLLAIQAQITKLQARFDDVLNDRVTVKVAKVAYCPSVGERVLATIGRNTPTSSPKVVEGVVTAVKLPAIVDGKAVGATQVRVRVYEGTFEEQLVTLYPAQLVPVPVGAGDDAADEAGDEANDDTDNS